MTNEKIMAFVAKLRKLSDHHNDEADKAAQCRISPVTDHRGLSTAYSNSARWLEEEMKYGKSDVPSD